MGLGSRAWVGTICMEVLDQDTSLGGVDMLFMMLYG